MTAPVAESFTRRNHDSSLFTKTFSTVSVKLGLRRSAPTSASANCGHRAALAVGSYVPTTVIGTGSSITLSAKYSRVRVPVRLLRRHEDRMSRLFVEHCEAVAAKIDITRRWLGEQ